MSSTIEKNITYATQQIIATTIANALKRAKPRRRETHDDNIAFWAWIKCVREMQHVVCSKDGVSANLFFKLCGVNDEPRTDRSDDEA